MYGRSLTQKILRNIDKKEVIFLLGTRQTGKTTLTKLVSQESNYNDNQIFFFDFEDKEYRALFNLKDAGVKTLQNILHVEGIDTSVKNLLILDEIQHLDDPSNFLKLLHDHFPHIKVIATGSSSLSIKSKFSDSLAGRKLVYHVEPLSFDEFLVFKGEEKLLKIKELFFHEKNKQSIKHIINSQHQRFLSLFNEYLIFGGYPEVVLIDDKKEKVNKLYSIADSYIKKDIRDIAQIKNIDAYNNLLIYVSINTGNLANISSIATAIKVSPATVSKYLNLLKETFIIDEVPPFFLNKNKEVSKNKKLYYKDNGIRNLQLKNFNGTDLRMDAGILYENHVFNVLSNNPDILINNYFYRTQSKTEIDFISETEQCIQLIEVKSGDFSKKPKALAEFDKKYKTEFNQIRKVVVNQSYYDFSGDVEFLPAYLL